MTDKELKKLSRSELLGLLITQMEENDKLSIEIDRLQEELNQKKIIIKNAGSIAEAAVGINKIFEAADLAVKQYIESVRHMADRGELIYEQENGENKSE
jgi:Trp operon repressor